MLADGQRELLRAAAAEHVQQRCGRLLRSGTEGGAVLLWDAEELGDELPEIMRVHFPDAETQPPIVLTYPRLPNVPPGRVGLAFQPPMKDSR